MIGKTFDEVMETELKDDKFAAAYLNHALNDHGDEFMIALYDTVKARGGKLPDDNGEDMQSIILMLLSAGLELKVVPKPK